MSRIGWLFKPYWRRLSGLLALIVVPRCAAAFLLRNVLVAIEAHDTRGVSVLAAGGRYATLVRRDAELEPPARV